MLMYFHCAMFQMRDTACTLVVMTIELQGIEGYGCTGVIWGPI